MHTRRGYSSSCCGCLGWGAACIFGNIQQPRVPAYWFLGDWRAPQAAFRKIRPALEALAVKNGAFGAVLSTWSRARGLRDAEYSGICTLPPGVPVGKRRPLRQSIHPTGRFMQKCRHGRASSSLERTGLFWQVLSGQTLGNQRMAQRLALVRPWGAHVAQRSYRQMQRRA